MAIGSDKPKQNNELKHKKRTFGGPSSRLQPLARELLCRRCLHRPPCEGRDEVGHSRIVFTPAGEKLRVAPGGKNDIPPLMKQPRVYVIRRNRNEAPCAITGTQPRGGELAVVSAPRPPCGCRRNNQPPLSVSHQGSRFNISPRRNSPSLSPTRSLTSPGPNRRPPSSENPPSSSRLCAVGTEEGSLQRPGARLGSAILCLQCAIGPCYGRSPPSG